MIIPQEIQLFAGRQIRTYWNDDEEKYYFCIIDAVEALLSIVMADPMLCENPAFKEAINYLAEGVDDVRHHHSISYDREARDGHKSAETSFIGYKTHIAMTPERIITAATVTTGEKDDGKQLPDLVTKTQDVGIDVDTVVGDAAYSGKDNLNTAKENGMITQGHMSARTDFDSENTPEWEVGDVISIDGHAYTATTAGKKSTFEGEGATEGTHHAYFPASLYISSTTAALPAIQTYTQAMATKKAAGLGTIERSNIFKIDYAKNATKLFAGKLFFADCNIGAKSETDYGGYYTWGGHVDQSVTCDGIYKMGKGIVNLTGPDDTATALWGSNWRMPTKSELSKTSRTGLLLRCTFTFTENYYGTGVNGWLCQGNNDYASNSIFLPAAGICSSGNVSGQGSYGMYWSSESQSSNTSTNANHVSFSAMSITTVDRDSGNSVRAVLVEQ